ncbi:MAG: Bor family protein [Pseudomonadota bacterium]
MTVIRTMALTGLIVFSTGCATQTFNLQDGASAEPKQETQQHFFVEGIGQDRTANASEVCGGADKVAKVEVEQEAIDVALSVLTFGIYTPRTARVFCVS